MGDLASRIQTYFPVKVALWSLPRRRRSNGTGMQISTAIAIKPPLVFSPRRSKVMTQPIKSLFVIFFPLARMS